MATRRRKHPLADEAQAALIAAEEARHTGDHRSGAASAAHAVALAEQAGQHRLQARALALLALHTWRIGNAEGAIGHALRALPMFKRERDAGDRAQLLCTLAMAYNDVGLHGEALVQVTKALDAAHASGDSSQMSWALNRAGVTYEMLGDMVRSERSALEALEIARRIDGKEEMFSALNNLSSVLVSAATLAPDTAASHQQLLRSVDFATEALRVAEASASVYRVTISLGNIGAALMHLGRFDEAERYMAQCSALSAQHGYLGLVTSMLAEQALLQRKRGDLASAVRIYQQALVEAREADNPFVQLVMHQSLYEIFKAGGDLAQALAHHEAMLLLERERMTQRADMQARLLLDRLELEHVRADAERARLDAEVQRLRAATLENENRQLERRATELGRHALEDALTGLANRRRIDHELPLQLANVREREDDLSLAAIDIDHFKQVNDRHGHAVGDDVLRALARILTSNVRASDVPARMGGEEFLVVFSDTQLATAIDICERLRQAVELFDWGSIATGLSLTISIGVCHAAGAPDVRTLLATADAALYAAKRHGRNRVEVAGAESSTD